MLVRLSGRTHTVMTAVAVMWRGVERSAVEEVRVTFHALTAAEMSLNKPPKPGFPAIGNKVCYPLPITEIDNNPNLKGT